MTEKIKKKGFQLTTDDVIILAFLFRLRLATIDHLIALTGRSFRVVHRRLEKLRKEKYVLCKRRPFQKYVFSIGRKSTEVLAQAGIDSIEALRWARKNREFSDLFLEHALMISDIHTALQLATSGSPFEIALWRNEDTNLRDSVWVREADRTETKLPIRPDAHFCLRDTRRPEGENSFNFFLEADRSTTTNKRFQRKIRGYSAYFEQGLHTKKFGIRSVRVLTVTLNEQRAKILSKASRDVLRKGVGNFYFFTPVSHFAFDNSDHIFEPIFISAEDFDSGKRYGFIPPL